MTLWNEALDDLNGIDTSIGVHLTVDQRLKIAEIKALLVIGQELSVIQTQGINPAWSSRD